MFIKFISIFFILIFDLTLCSPIPCATCGRHQYYGRANSVQMAPTSPLHSRRAQRRAPARRAARGRKRARSYSNLNSDDDLEGDVEGTPYKKPQSDAIFVFRHVPMNPLSDPSRVNLEDIPLVPENQIVFLDQPYFIVVDDKTSKSKDKKGSEGKAKGKGKGEDEESEEGSTEQNGSTEEGEEGDSSTEGGEGSTEEGEGSTEGGGEASTEAGEE